jgi:hypothetical protein
MSIVSRTAGVLPLDRVISWPEVVRSATLWRYVAYCMLLSTCLLFYSWSRIDAMETALLLNHARTQATMLQTEHDWLALELSTLQDVASLHARATQMGLVDGNRVHTVK